MDLPELPLECDGFGHLGRRFGVRMHIGEREVPKDESHGVSERREQLLDDRIRLAAVGTLVVAVLDDGEFRVERTARVIVGPDEMCIRDSS